MLVIPTFGYNHGYPTFFSNSDFPTGFAYLASAIKNAGHKVIGLNPNNDPSYKSAKDMVYSKISQCLLDHDPDLIGLGGLSADYHFIRDALEIIRDRAPETPVVLGGGIIENDEEFIFSTLHPDFSIIGEAEETIVELISMLASGKQEYGEIANLSYWDKDTPVISRRDFNYIHLDERVFPDYEPFDMDRMLDEYSLATRYVYRYVRPNPRVMSIVSARGCPFTCTFCIHGRADDRKYRIRSMKSIMAEIKQLYDRYNFNILIILDELFIAKKGRLKEFCIALNKEKKKYNWDFNWIFQTHANSEIDYKIFKMAKDEGCYTFTYGLETASPKVLDSMQKKSKLPEIIKAINLADDLGLGFYAAFIFGDIAEDKQTIDETMSFFNRHCKNLHLNFTAISPYPGSKLFTDCINRGIITDKKEYYETIDEQVYNMTNIPNRIYFPWVYLVMYLGQFFQYTKSTKATLFKKDGEATANNPIALHRQQAIYKIKAECPHCKKENNYTELLNDEVVANTSKNGEDAILTETTLHNPAHDPLYEPKSKIPNNGHQNATLQEILRRMVGVRVKQYNLTKLISEGAIYFLVSFMNPIYKNLKPLIGENKLEPYFVTGCQNCNKRIKVIIPLNKYNHKFNTIRWLLKKFYV